MDPNGNSPSRKATVQKDGERHPDVENLWKWRFGQLSKARFGAKKGCHWPNQNLHFLEGFMVNNLVFRWPKPLFFMVLGAHGMCIHRKKKQKQKTYSLQK